MRSKVRASMSGPTRRNIMETGLTTRCMGRVTLPGLMASNTLASSKKTNVMDMAASFGKTSASTREVGTRVSSMESAFTPTIKELKDRGYGKRENARNGSTESSPTL